MTEYSAEYSLFKTELERSLGSNKNVFVGASAGTQATRLILEVIRFAGAQSVYVSRYCGVEMQDLEAVCGAKCVDAIVSEDRELESILSGMRPSVIFVDDAWCDRVISSVELRRLLEDETVKVVMRSSRFDDLEAILPEFASLVGATIDLNNMLWPQ